MNIWQFVVFILKVLTLKFYFNCEHFLLIDRHFSVCVMHALFICQEPTNRQERYMHIEQCTDGVPFNRTSAERAVDVSGNKPVFVHPFILLMKTIAVNVYLEEGSRILMHLLWQQMQLKCSKYKLKKPRCFKDMNVWSRLLSHI